jgi:hypothetical protein
LYVFVLVYMVLTFQILHKLRTLLLEKEKGGNANNANDVLLSDATVAVPVDSF